MTFKKTVDRKLALSLTTLRAGIALALLAVLIASPSYAKFNWRTAWAVASTVGGVGIGVTGNPFVGAALIGLQGSMLTTDAVLGDDENTASEGETPLLDVPGPVTTEPARRALIREYPLIELTGDQEIDYFLSATNEVFEYANVLVRSHLEGAPVEQLRGELAEYGRAVERAAVEYDRMGLDFKIDQGDIDAFQRSVATEGLPAAEADFLTRLGFTDEEAESFAMLVSTAPVHLTRAVTPGEVLHAAAESIAASN